jgi:hypothetical protein
VFNNGVCYSLPTKNPDSNDQENKGYLLAFGLQRNRAHFKLMKDPKLSQYFAPDFVWDVRHFENYAEFERMVSVLRQANSRVLIGSYMSACTAVPSKKDSLPPSKMPLEQCKDEWLLRTPNGRLIAWPKMEDRYFLDMRRPDVRETVISLAVARAKYNGLDALCFDNCYWNTGQPDPSISKEEWTSAFMSFYEEAGNAAHSKGLKLVLNVATNADGIAEAFAAISPYADGMMTEMAFHPNMRTPEGIHYELKGYERVLKQGKMVFLIPRRREDEQFALLAIRPLAKKYGNIYLVASGPAHYEPLYRVVDTEWNTPADSN